MVIADRRKVARRVLLAVDGCEQAFEAVRYVGGALPFEQTEVVLFHVMGKIPETFYDVPDHAQGKASIRSWEFEQKKRIDEFMEESVEFLVDSGFSRETVIVDIRPRKVGIARDIAAEAQHGYNAIVVGRVGVSRLKDIVLGSVGNKLIQKLTHIPVCVVGGKPEPGNVLLALDASEEALKIVDHVGDMFGGSDCNVLLFHVIRGVTSCPRRPEHIIPGDEEEWIERPKGIMEIVFNEARKRLVKAGMDASRITAKFSTLAESRARAIVKEAEEQRYDTIVVGRRGLSKIQEFYMGRVSNKIIQMAKEMAVYVVS